MLCKSGLTMQLAHDQNSFATYQAYKVSTFLENMQVLYTVKQLGMSLSFLTAQHVRCQSQGLNIGTFRCPHLCSWHAVTHI